MTVEIEVKSKTVEVKRRGKGGKKDVWTQE
jgi:hypothetical protein